MLRAFSRTHPAWQVPADPLTGRDAAPLPRYEPHLAPDTPPTGPEEAPDAFGPDVATRMAACRGGNGGSDAAAVESLGWLAAQQALCPQDAALGSHDPRHAQQLVSLAAFRPGAGNVASQAFEPPKLVARHQAGQVLAGELSPRLWSEASLRPLAQACHAFCAIVCPQEDQAAATAACRNAADIYQAAGLGALLPAGGWPACAFPYAAPAAAEGRAWQAALQQALRRLRRSLLASQLQTRPVGAGLAARDAPVLVFLSLPRSGALLAPEALRLAALVLQPDSAGRAAQPECVGMPRRSPGPAGQLRSGGLAGERAAAGEAAACYLSCQQATPPEAALVAGAMPAVALQLLAPDCLTDFCGDSLHALPFAAFTRLSAAAGQHAGGCAADALFAATKETDLQRVANSLADGGGALHVAYAALKGTAVLGWALADGRRFGCRVLPMSPQEAGESSGVGPVTPSAEASDAADAEQPPERQRLGPALAEQAAAAGTAEASAAASATAEAAVSAVHSACLQLLQELGGGRAEARLRCVIASAQPMPACEAAAWRALLAAAQADASPRPHQSLTAVSAETCSSRWPADLQQPVMAAVSAVPSGEACCRLLGPPVLEPLGSAPQELELLSFQVVAQRPEGAGQGQQADGGPAAGAQPATANASGQGSKGSAAVPQSPWSSAEPGPGSLSSAGTLPCFQIARELHTLSCAAATLARFCSSGSNGELADTGCAALPLHIAVCQSAAALYGAIAGLQA